LAIDGARCALLSMLLVMVAADPGAVAAQQFAVVPSFEITEFHDDNVFYRPEAESDTATRFSPRVEVRDQSERAIFSARYALDADRFAHHAELSTPLARQEGSVAAQYLASRRLSFRGVGTYLESQTPADFNQETGLAPGRLRAERANLQPAATYQVDVRTDATVGYTLNRDVLAGGATLLSQTATSTLQHQRSNRDVVGVGYTYQRYGFELSGSAAVRQSQTVAVEWRHDVGRLTSVAVRVGPRVTDGALSPEIAASIRRRLRAGEASVAYLRTRTTVIGLTGVVDTQGLAATLAGEPLRGVTISARPGLSYTRQLHLSSVVYRLALSCARPVTRRLAFEADYDFNLQHGNIYSAQALETIERNLALVRLVVAAARPDVNR